MDDIINYLPSFAEQDGRITKWTALSLKSRSMLYAASIANFGTEQLNGLLGINNSETNFYYQKSLEASREIIRSGIFSFIQKRF